MSQNSEPPCPWCHSSKHVQASGTTMKAMYCRRCGREFEADDMDGEIGYGSPEKYAQRAERRRQQRKAIQITFEREVMQQSPRFVGGHVE